MFCNLGVKCSKQMPKKSDISTLSKTDTAGISRLSQKRSFVTSFSELENRKKNSSRVSDNALRMEQLYETVSKSVSLFRDKYSDANPAVISELVLINVMPALRDRNEVNLVKTMIEHSSQS